MKQPVIVYVSGAPGSGKTTLAKLLSEQLYVPHVSSDLIHGGIAFTQPAHDRRQTIRDIFVPTMIAMAKRHISFVVDHVLQKGMAETSIIDKLRPYATIMYIHTKATDPIRRYTDRVQNSELPSIIERRAYLLERAAVHRENLEATNEPLALEVPTLVVNTDKGYEPALSEIVAFIKSKHAV
jgi:cytidylate kinase